MCFLGLFLFTLSESFCQCDSGYYGIDCSIPTASVLQKWPAWLRPSIAEVAHNSPNVEIVVRKKRPLIYVYDLPPEFNSHLLEVRIHFSNFMFLSFIEVKTRFTNLSFQIFIL